MRTGDLPKLSDFRGKRIFNLLALYEHGTVALQKYILLLRRDFYFGLDCQHFSVTPSVRSSQSPLGCIFFQGAG
jgi:hypothetical protein